MQLMEICTLLYLNVVLRVFGPCSSNPEARTVMAAAYHQNHRQANNHTLKIV